MMVMIFGHLGSNNLMQVGADEVILEFIEKKIEFQRDKKC